MEKFPNNSIHQTRSSRRALVMLFVGLFNYLMKIFLPLLLLVMTASATEKELKIEDWSIPSFVRDIFVSKHLNAKYQISFHLNPFYQSGDFDGDGKIDVAILVKEKSSGKTGIAIYNSSQKNFIILGAGNIFKGGKDLDWMDAWQPYPKGIISRGVAEGPPPKLIGDAILAEKTEAASGLIYWSGKNYKWYQQGD
jgi:hypothetical protein